jgi:hypothetical protein
VLVSWSVLVVVRFTRAESVEHRLDRHNPPPARSAGIP